MTGTRKFENDAVAVRAARQFALKNLPGYSPEVLDVVELLVSELATNSVRHTESEFELRVSGDPRRIRISVTDRGTGWPAVQSLDPAALSGRGLALVEMLSSSWGISRSRSAAGGKTVWLVLDVADHQFQPRSKVRARASDARAQSARPPRAMRRSVSARGPRCGVRLRERDWVRKDADPLDLDLDLVSRFQRDLGLAEDAHTVGRTGQDQVSWQQCQHRRRIGDQSRNVED